MKKYTLPLLAALAFVSTIALSQVSGGSVFRNLTVRGTATINDLTVSGTCTGCGGGGGGATVYAAVDCTLFNDVTDQASCVTLPMGWSVDPETNGFKITTTLSGFNFDKAIVASESFSGDPCITAQVSRSVDNTFFTIHVVFYQGNGTLCTSADEPIANLLISGG